MDSREPGLYVPGVGLTQVPLPSAAAVVVGLVAFGAVAMDAGWQVIRYGTVMAHEGAHAVIGSLSFRHVNGITLNADASGATSMNPGGCLGGIVVALAGYVGPSLFGLGAARLIQMGHIVAVLWVALFLLGILLTGLRRSYGMITVALVGGAVYLLGHYTPAGAQVVAAYGITWLLLLSGVRRVLEVGAASGDGAYLAGLTHLPRALWFLVWLAATLGAVAAGGSMLVMRP